MSEYFGRRYGPYVILEQLGQGGMARVYNALDSRTHQNVAIKVLLPGKRTSRIFLDQFEKEAKALANLTHGNIVKVLDYGIQDEQPYLVMEYVPGGSLKDALKHKVPWQTAAAFLAPIARALDYVHQQQIVHRDVKPSNILLQDDFRPMLADFGIVKLLETKDEKVEEAIGVGVGTPEYMAPEQAMGRDVDFRVDIYSLGLVFYEMITGRKPYAADSPVAVALKHVTDKLILPTRIDRTIPRFVEHVILRAVQKDPENRFTSMAHFAEALELIAQGERTSGGKATKISRQQRKKSRQSFSFYAVSIFLFFMIMGASFAVYNYIIGSTPPMGTLPASAAATAVPFTPTLPVISPTFTQVPATAVRNDITPSPASGINSDLPLLGTPLPGNYPSDFSEIARWGIGQINIGRWSPDGGTIALGTTNGIYLYDAQTEELKRFINTGFNVTELAFRPAGDELAAGSPTGLVQSWNWRSGQSLQNFSYSAPENLPFARSSPVTVITYSRDGQNLAAGYENGSVNYFAIGTGNPIWKFANPPTVSDLVISDDGRFIFVSNETDKVRIWDASIMKQQEEPLINPAAVRKLRLSMDGQMMLAGGNGQSVYLWDPNSLTLSNSFANLGGKATDFDFSFDGGRVAIGLATGDIKVFETPALADTLKSPVLESTFKVYPGQITSLAFSPTRLVIAAGNGQRSLQVMDAQSGAGIFELKNEMSPINRLYFSSNGSWLTTAHEDGVVRIWDVQQAKLKHQVEGYLPKGDPFSPDNRFLVYVHPAGKNKPDAMEVLDLQTWKPAASLPDYKKNAFVQFRDDSRVLVMGDPYSAKLWDVATWQEINITPNAIEECGRYLTPQGNLVAVISLAGVLFSYDEMIQDMCATNPTGAILKFFFMDQKKLLFVMSDGSVWTGFSSSKDLRLDRPSEVYPASDDIFLAGDQSGWYAYVDGTIIRIKNLGSGSSGTTIEEQHDYRYRVAFLPKKRLLALGSRYGTIHIWSMP